MRLDVIPLKSVGDVRFGMSRGEVRAVWGDAEEFKKDPDDVVTTDDFGFCHVFYDEDNKCEAVEIFDAEVFIDGKQVYPIDMDRALELLPDLEEDDIGPISYERSIGIYAPDDEMESILFGRDGYYE